MRVGIFDSGIGGHSVLRAVERELPGLDLIYCSDPANLPYGTKSAAEIRTWVLGATQGLELDLLVLACHTASAHALDLLREKLAIPVIGMVEASLTEAKGYRRVGLIATASTLLSSAYPPLPFARACPLFVQLVEAGLHDGPLAREVARHYLADLPPLDALILGCTHYPFLREVIQETVGAELKLIDGIDACVEEIGRHCRRSEPVPQ